MTDIMTTEANNIIIKPQSVALRSQMENVQVHFTYYKHGLRHNTLKNRVSSILERAYHQGAVPIDRSRKTYIFAV